MFYPIKVLSLIGALALLSGCVTPGIGVSELSRPAYPKVHVSTVEPLIMYRVNNSAAYMYGALGALMDMGMKSLQTKDWRLGSQPLQEHINSLDLNAMLGEELQAVSIPRLGGKPSLETVEAGDRTPREARIHANWGMNMFFAEGGVLVTLVLDGDKEAKLSRIYQSIVTRPDSVVSGSGCARHTSSSTDDDCEGEYKSPVTINSEYWTPQSYETAMRDALKNSVALMRRDLANELAPSATGKIATFLGGYDFMPVKGTVVEEATDHVIVRTGAGLYQVPRSAIRKMK